MGKDGNQGVNREWAASLPISGAHRLALLRHRADVAVCAVRDRAWIRGKAWDHSLGLLLRSLLGCQRYWVMNDGQLIPDGCRRLVR